MLFWIILILSATAFFIFIAASYQIGWRMCDAKHEKEFFFSGSRLQTKKAFSPYPNQILTAGKDLFKTTQALALVENTAKSIVETTDNSEEFVRKISSQMSNAEILVLELEKEIALKSVLLEDVEAKTNDAFIKLSQSNIELEDARFMIQKLEIAFGKEVINSILTHEANSKLAGLSNILEIKNSTFEENSPFENPNDDTDNFDKFVFYDDAASERPIAKVEEDINYFDDESRTDEQEFTFSNDRIQNSFEIVKESASFGEDDLVKLRGIGVATKRKLNELGVFTFKQIVSWSDDKQEFVAKRLVKFEKKREKWIVEAKNAHFEKYGERL